MAYYHQVAPQLANEFKQRFPDLTVEQIWTIVKFSKLVRRSCRSNAALYPACEITFPGFKFKDYDTGKKNAKGRPIKHLSITDKQGKKFQEESQDEEGDE